MTVFEFIFIVFCFILIFQLWRAHKLIREVFKGWRETIEGYKEVVALLKKATEIIDYYKKLYECTKRGKDACDKDRS